MPDDDKGALGNLPIGNRKRALWRAFKRWPDDPRLLRWRMDRQYAEMANSIWRMMAGDFKKSIVEPPPFYGLADICSDGADPEWRSISGSVKVSPTELEPT